jgi:hypothetical protein
MLGGRHLVMVLLDLDPHRRHGSQHLATHVLSGVQRRNREISTLDRDAMPEISALVIGIAIDGQLGRVELETGVVGVRHEFHVVEHEELGLRADEHGIAHPGRLQVGLGLLRDAPRIAVVWLAGGRLQDVADDGKGRRREERVHLGRGRIGHEGHVRLVDGFPASNRRSVEHDAVGEHVLVDDRDVERHVLPLAARIREPEIDVLDVVVLDGFEHIVGGLHGLEVLFALVMRSAPVDRRG